MSSTRYAKDGSPLRQERFSSSYKRGLLANLVANRCAEIDPPADRAAIWFAQAESWKPGGLAIHASKILRRYPLVEWREEAKAEPMPLASERMIRELVDDLERLCLDPRSALADVWETLNDYRGKWITELPTGVQTSIGRQVASALEYTQQTRTLGLIDGPARIGKSFEARAFCAGSAGLARYVQVPCSNDEASFFRAIGQSLGVSSSLQLRTGEIRDRVDEVLQAGDLMLVLDEAHYLWPQHCRPSASPFRVNWINTALVNHNVPVALVTTPQFYASQQRVERLTDWTSEQFIGRIGHVERLPGRLGRADLVMVARALLPGADAATWGALAAYAVLSKKHLASIEAIAKRAAWLAGQDGKPSATAAYVHRAMKASVIPSDTALAESLAPGRQARRNTLARLPRMARGCAAAAGPSISVEDDPGTLITEPRGSLVTT